MNGFEDGVQLRLLHLPVRGESVRIEWLSLTRENINLIKMKLKLFVACILYLSLPVALSLKCQAGCKATGGPGADMACSGLQTGIITCDEDAYQNRCMTITLTMSPFPGFTSEIEMKNCSSSFVCDPSSNFHMCSLLNSTGVFSDCSFHCCQGDMCNGPAHFADFVRRLFGRYD